MMQPAQQRLRDDSKADRQAMVVGAPARRLALRIWDARSQTRMRASVVVMSDPLREYPTDVLLVEWNYPIQTLATNRADQPFAIRIRFPTQSAPRPRFGSPPPCQRSAAAGRPAIAVALEALTSSAKTTGNPFDAIG